MVIVVNIRLKVFIYKYIRSHRATGSPYMGVGDVLNLHKVRATDNLR